jgi:hypothetical protein
LAGRDVSHRAANHLLKLRKPTPPLGTTKSGHHQICAQGNQNP